MIALKLIKEKVSAFMGDFIAKRWVRWHVKNGSGVEMTAACPSLELLAAFVEHNLLPKQKDEVESHLVECNRCRKIVVMVYRSQKAVPDPVIPPPEKF